jgi:CheY-like chemotaxis protein
VHNRRSLRVLLAEDNSVNQTLATRLLQKFGHTVEVAANGVIAVEKWKQGKYDLILMDVGMPELNGYGATEQIRAAERESGAHIPIIGLTAHAGHGARESCLAHGMDGYLSKPIGTEALWVELEGVKGVADETEENASVAVEVPHVRFVFDMKCAMELMANDRALFNEMVRIYLEDYPGYLARLQEAVANADADQTRYLAHTIKGMLSVFAVREISDIAQRIEEQVGADHRSSVVALAEGLSWLALELRKHKDSN